ncbi:beta-eliminating lyase-related protein [Ahrensia marina]|uniref:threonine aldolase family protein n=1 Tax=Ahrensia marina TaxID=1514904 RepID=UPI0035D0763D
MFFGSDNWAGVSPQVAEALSACTDGFASAYGSDDLTTQARDALGTFFDRDVDVFFTATGSAANMLSLSAVARPGGVVFAHRDAHILVDEAAGPESLVGMKLHALIGCQGRINAKELTEALATYPREHVHRGRGIAVSMTQGTELGTTYCVMDVAAIGAIARRNNLVLHMDGARFSNALVAQNVTPAAITHESGVDLLSLGFTKNGAWASEMVVSFREDLRDDLTYRQKAMGQVFSKNRFAAAQALAMLKDDHWKVLASHANGMAKKLSDGITNLDGCRLAAPTEINEVFAIIPQAMAQQLEDSGAIFADWPEDSAEADIAPGEGEMMIRLVASFATTDDHVDQFLDAAQRAEAA